MGHYAQFRFVLLILCVVSITAATVPGMDVSGHQPNVDWQKAYNRGARFAYIKATEGTGFKNPNFTSQYTGSYRVGMIRGSYHFALPDRANGSAQAAYFVQNGGRWSKDGKTLPGALDIEYNPYGAKCYGLSQQAMAAWIRSFVNTYKRLTTVYPVIYTTTDWYSTCVGNHGDFSSQCPLWIAAWSSRPPSRLPFNWHHYTFWQFSDQPNPFPGNQDCFNGDLHQLQAFALDPKVHDDKMFQSE